MDLRVLIPAGGLEAGVQEQNSMDTEVLLCIFFLIKKKLFVLD